MKKTVTPIPVRALVLTLLMILGLGSFSAFSQKDILLYSTDFTDWTALASSGTSSNPIGISTGAGAGFTASQDASVDPITGKYWISGSTSGRDLIMKPFTFIAGGEVEMELEMTGGGSDRTFGITGGTVTSAMIGAYNNTSVAVLNYNNLVAGATSLAGVPTSTIDLTKIGQYYAGATVKILKTAVGRVTVTFRIPGLVGSVPLTITGLRQDMPLRKLKVYTTVAGSYVASTNYPGAPAAGLAISGAVGGPTVNGTVNVKAWNITGPVTMSIVGTDAAKFTLPVTSLTEALAEAATGQAVTIQFKPSVRAGVSSAQLKLSAAGAPDYFVNIAGLSASGVAPQITTSATTLPFWASLIAKATNTVTIAGVNLTGNVTLSIVGPNAGQFSIPVTSVSKANASAGYPLAITYTGDITVGAQSATLVISSPGATTVNIPLSAQTLDSKPVLYDLILVPNPSGSGFVDIDPAGTKFLDGTVLNVVATPESGYYLSSWGDGKASNYTSRTWTLTDKTKGTYPVNFTTIPTTPPPPPGSKFVAYEPVAMANTSFTATWPTVALATGYTVTVYNLDGTVKTTIPIPSGATSSTNITGLTAGTFYSYSVETTGLVPVQNTGKSGPYKTTGGTSGFTCGQP